MTELVLLHGWGTHPVIWEPLLEHLPGDWSVHNLPLPGYAGANAASPYELEALADALAPRLPDYALLVGWSLGGLVALLIARRWREKSRGLVLIGATPCFVMRPGWPHAVAQEVFAGFAQSLAQDYADTLRRFLALQAQGSDSVRTVLKLLRERLLAQPRPQDAVLEAGLAILQETDLRGSLDLAVPLTLVHGSGDKLAPLAAARWLAQHVHSAELRVIDGAGHAPFLSHPAEVAEIIRAAAGG
ncbi:MAG TPA: pimeloyl-ACP methyl ester esterase BioH [Thiobacillaceae bacterium]|nr:pimeloyl-ACP methyl ester esterase BioH [Thiobacillaceae bacterium]